MPSDKTRRLYAILLALLLAAGALLRLLHLGEPSLWWDEFITLGIAKLPVSRMLHTLTVVGPSDIGGEFFPPLYHLLTHVVLAASRNDAVLRLLSVACGTATIGVVYALGAAVFSRSAGICAAALTTCSVYQIHYSRELRPYSLFMLLGLLSLLTLYRALAKGGLGRYAAYVAATTAMCYTAYTATSNIAAEGVFTAWFLLRGLATREFSPGQALRKGLALAGCVATAAILYIPWFTAYKNVFTFLKSGGGSPSIPSDFLHTVLSEFGSYAAPGPGLPWLPLALLGLLGGVVALHRQWRDGLALLAAFALMPLVAFLVAATKLELSSRYLFNTYYVLIALAGLGAAWIADRTTRHMTLAPQRAAWAAPLAGVFLCLLVSIPNLRSLSIYYRRETSYYKELSDYLTWNKNNIRTLFFQKNRNAKLVADWYMPGAFDTLSHYAPDGYKRAFYLIENGKPAPEVPFLSVRRAVIQDTAVSAMGLVSTAPVALFPDADGNAVYIEDFTTYKFYADCDVADNLAPDSLGRTLAHYDSDKPGYADYRFVAAAGTRITRATVRLDFSATVFLTFLPSDSRVAVSLAVGDGPWREAGVVTGDDLFGRDGKALVSDNNHEYGIHREFPVDIAGDGATQVRLRIAYGPVFEPGVIEVSRIEVKAALDGAPTGPDPAEAALWRAAGHNALARWLPGEPLVDTDALYAFPAAPEIAQGPANPYASLAAFRQAHPGLAPVFTIPGPDGSPAYLFFDPALSDPFVRLTPGVPVTARLGQTPPQEFAALKLQGALHRPRLDIGGKTVTVPVFAPAPTTLLLQRNTGVLRFEPSFHSESEALAAFPLAENIRKNANEDCLSCNEPGPCAVTVPLSSAFPLRLLRIVSYPRIYADKAGKNNVTVSFSTDGKHFKVLDRLVSDRSGLWEGLMTRRISVLRFDKPVTTGFVRFALSESGAQLWSKEDMRMRIEAELDAMAFTGIPVAGEALPLTLRDNADAPLSLFLSPRPLPYLPGLQDDF